MPRRACETPSTELHKLKFHTTTVQCKTRSPSALRRPRRGDGAAVGAHALGGCCAEDPRPTEADICRALGLFHRAGRNEVASLVLTSAAALWTQCRCRQKSNRVCVLFVAQAVTRWRRCGWRWRCGLPRRSQSPAWFPSRRCWWPPGSRCSRCLPPTRCAGRARLGSGQLEKEI